MPGQRLERLLVRVSPFLKRPGEVRLFWVDLRALGFWCSCWAVRMGICLVASGECEHVVSATCHQQSNHRIRERDYL